MREGSRSQREAASATTDGDVAVDCDDDAPADAPADVAPELTERPRDPEKWTVDSPTEVRSR